MRPISCVAWGPNRLDLFGLAMDSQAVHKGWDGSVWASNWEPLGGVFASSIAVASRGVNLLDLFGLGEDYSMFHKRWDGKAWSGWEGLGGVFTSPPAVVATAPNRLDVFGLAEDHSLVHRWWNGSQWSAGWEALGGAFTSQPEVVSAGPNQLDVFAVGSDFAMHHRSWNGAAWSQWESLGGTFTSQPAVVAWQASHVTTGGNRTTAHAAAPPLKTSTEPRLTVFGLGTDNVMYYRSFEGGAWPGNWMSLGGAFSGPPAVVSWGPNRLDVFGVGTDSAMHHRAYAGSWAPNWTSLGGQFTSPPAVVTRGPNKLDIFGIGGDYAMYHSSGDGNTFATWERQGGQFELPGTFRFSLDSFEILDTRSVHNDTDSVAVTITVGARPPQTLLKKTGDVNNGVHDLSMAFAPVNVDLSDVVVFNYLILNGGHSEQKTIDDELTKIANTLAGKGVQAAIKALGTTLSFITDHLSDVAAFFVGNLISIILADCDGPVAAEQVVLSGVQLRKATIHRPVVTQQTTHLGTDSNRGCGGNSRYKTNWTYQPVNH